jgi:O-antigen polymerase
LPFNYKTIGLIVILGSCSLLIDPYAYYSITAPKHLVFITGAPLLMFLIVIKSKSIYMGLIPILYVLRLSWLAIGNPEWVTHPSNDGVYISVGILCWLVFTGELKSKSNKELFLRVIFLVGVIEVAVGIWQIIDYVPNPSYPIKTPFTGTFGTPNGLGIFLVISFLSGIYLLYSNPKNVWVWLGSLFVLAGIILSESRGSVLALLSSAVLIFVVIGYQSQSLIRRRLVMVSGILLLSVLGILLYHADTESTSGRWIIWEITNLMIIENPVLGVGQGNYSVEYLNYQAEYFENLAHKRNEIKAANIKQAPNEFLQSFAEGGILSAVLLLVIWLIPFHYCWQRLMKGVDYLVLTQLAIHTSIFIHALVDSPLHVLPVAIVGYTNIALISVNKFQIQIKGKTRITVLLILMPYLVFSSIKQIRKYPGYHDWKKGVDHITELDWEASMLDLNDAVEKLPRKGELLYNLGASHIFNENYSRGLYYLEESKKYFNDRNIYLSGAYAHMKLGDLKEAEVSALTALKMFPTHLAPHLLLGEIYYYLGDIKQSKTSLMKCINEEIEIKSVETRQISEDARDLWNRFYGKIE